MAEITVRAPGDSTSGTYFDYMKTVYARAGFPEMIQLPLTSFDNNFELHGMAAESWTQSEDGLTWTFTLREGLTFSDGEPLTAEDFVFALQRAATSGYDFAWYWDFAGGIKGWKEVTEGTAGPETLGIVAVDDRTIQVTTNTPKPYLPSVVSLWYPVPKHMVDQYGDDYATMSKPSSLRAPSCWSPGKSPTIPWFWSATRPIPGRGRAWWTGGNRPVARRA